MNGLSYQPRQDGGSNGNIGQHTVSLSTDGETWEQVAFGAFLNDKTTKRSFFSNATARYVRLTAQSEAQGSNLQFSSAAELQVYSPDPALDAASFEPPDPAVAGRWTTTLDLPLVPAAAALVPDGDVVLWSAYRPDLFSGGTGLTQTVVWNPNSEAVSQKTVSNTRHDMFVSFIPNVPSLDFVESPPKVLGKPSEISSSCSCGSISMSGGLQLSHSTSREILLTLAIRSARVSRLTWRAVSWLPVATTTRKRRSTTPARKPGRRARK